MMIDWLEWYAKKGHEVKLPIHLQRMRAVHGARNDQKCGDCVHFRRLAGYSRSYFKCDLSKLTHGAGTDWRAKWPACGKWEEMKESEAE